MKRVVLVGEDRPLLETRGAVVERLGVRVSLLTSSELMEEWPHQDCDLIVLCHTLSEDQRSEIAAAVHRRWKTSRVLQLVSPWTRHITPNADAVAESNPRSLVGTVTELLKIEMSC